MIRKLHEDHGVQFHLPGKVRSLSDHQVVLESNETLDADLVVVGIGVRPSLGLAGARTTIRKCYMWVMLRLGIPCKSMVQSKLGTAALRSGAPAEYLRWRP